jgi:hypothetical protein
MSGVEHFRPEEREKSNLLVWEKPDEEIIKLHKDYFMLHNLDLEAKIAVTSFENQNLLNKRVEVLNRGLMRLISEEQLDQIEPELWTPNLPIVVARHPAKISSGTINQVLNKFYFYENLHANSDRSYEQSFRDLLTYTNKFIIKTNAYALPSMHLAQFTVPRALQE